MKLIDVSAALCRASETHKLTVNVLHTLLVLHDRGATTMWRLASESSITTAAITGRLKALERAGLAKRKRCLGDERKVLASITPAGIDAVNEIVHDLRRSEMTAAEAH